MRLLGRVLHLGARGPILRTPEAPKLGQPVFNSKRKRVGNVQDIFGPVKNPYVVLKPASGVSAESLVGSPVYVEEKPAKRRTG
jgi:rRNA processing protein Gar1